MNLLEKRALVFCLFSTLILQLFLTFFFKAGSTLPLTIDTHLANYQESLFTFPPQGAFKTDYWLGMGQPPQGIHPYSLFVHLPFWIVATTFYPLCSTLALGTAFLLFRFWGFRFYAALLGGVLYAWQGPLLSNLLPAHFTPAVLFALFPLAFWLACKGLATGRALFWCWAGVCSGMMILYLPDQGFLANSLIGLYLIYAWIRSRLSTSLFLFLKGMALWALLTILTMIPAVPGVLMQNLEGVRPNDPAQTDQQYQWATQWSFTLEESIQYLIPGFLGWHNLSEEGPYWGRIGQSPEWMEKNEGMRNYMLGINTLGTLSALLVVIALFSLFKKELKLTQESQSLRSLLLFFTATAFLYWILGLGKFTPLHRLFYEIPGMDTWRNPLKFILLPGNFCLIVIALAGAQRFYELLEIKNENTASFLYLKNISTFLSFSLLGFIPLYLFLTILLPVALPVFHYSSVETSRIIGTLLGSILIAVLTTGVWLGLTRLIENAEKVRHYPLLNPWISSLRNRLFHEKTTEITWFMGIAILTMLQMAWVHQHYFLPQSPQSLTVKCDLIEDLRPSETSSQPIRVKIMTRDAVLSHFLNIRFPYHQISSIDIPAASRIPPDYETYFKFLTPDPLRLSEVSGVGYWLGSFQEWTQYSDHPSFKNALGKTRFYTGTPDSPSTLKRLPDAVGAQYALTELKNALPRFKLFSQIENFTSEEALYQRMTDPQWNPHQSILLLNSPLLGSSPPSPTTPAATLVVQQYDSQKIKLRIESAEPLYLLTTDRYDKNWKAQINGEPTSILQANGIQRAIAIPAGKSEVLFSYEAPSFPVYLQLFSLLILTVVSVRVIRNARS